MIRLLAAVVAAWTLAACEPPPESWPTEPVAACEAVAWDGAPRRRNVVLIVNDTMRRDRVGVYGGTARTPAFDAVAAAGFHLTRMSSQAPWTKPSIATLFTGLYPSQHGVLSHPALPDPESLRPRDERIEADVLGDDFVTLAEVLRDAGYRTAAFVANPWMQRRFGFAQGFDEYVDRFPQGWHVPGGTITQLGLDFLAAQDGAQPYFLYLHYIDSHGPYGRIAPEDLERHAERIAADERPVPKNARIILETQIRLADGRPLGKTDLPLRLALLDVAYDKGIEDFDRALAPFLAGLDASPSAADTALLVTSDHGEALFERGWGNHGQGLHSDEIAVPFAARMPGVAARGAVDCPAGLIDVLATLCAYLGVECPASSFGVPLLRAPAPAAPPPPRYLVSEGVMWRPEHRSVANEHYRLLWEPGGRPRGAVDPPPRSLFAVDRDPEEREDLLAGDSREGQAVFDALLPRLRDAVPAFAAPAPETAPIDADTRRRLEALGYLDGATEADPPAKD